MLVTFNRPLFRAQVKTLRREINTRQKKHKELQLNLARSRTRTKGRKPSLSGTRKRVGTILCGRHIKDLFNVAVEPDAHELPTITWSLNQEAWKRLQSTLLGKTILFTDRQEWSDEQIVLAYRSQSHVESAFRAMKNPLCLALRPIHHWTDQKLRLHALYSVIALMILTLLRRKLSGAAIPLSLARMVEQLSDIKEVTLVYPSGDSRSLRARTVLSELDSEQHSIFDALELASVRAA